MEINNYCEKTPENKTKRTIPDKFGYWFALNLPNFFYGGVTLHQIADAMPADLFEEWCELNHIIYYNHNEKQFVQKMKGGKQ